MSEENKSNDQRLSDKKVSIPKLLSTMFVSVVIFITVKIQLVGLDSPPELELNIVEAQLRTVIQYGVLYFINVCALTVIVLIVTKLFRSSIGMTISEVLMWGVIFGNLLSLSFLYSDWYVMNRISQ
jgi:hypothetical protein